MTKRSTNLIKEYRNYLWLTDREGKTINDPQDFLNHCLDALRYGFNGQQIPKPILTGGVPYNDPSRKWGVYGGFGKGGSAYE